LNGGDATQTHLIAEINREVNIWRNVESSARVTTIRLAVFLELIGDAAF
jgi:hypothetical protein